MEPSRKKPPLKKKWLLLAAIAAVLTAFCLWYTRPVPFQDLIPGAELPPCHQIRVHASYEREQGRQPEEYQLTITPEDPSFDPLLSLFTGQSYRRSLGNLLPRGGRIHSTQPGDFKWLVYLDYEEPITLPDGSEASGALLHFTNFMVPWTSASWERIGRPIPTSRSSGCGRSWRSSRATKPPINHR